MTPGYPATQYACVDDKLLTIWVRQCNYSEAATSKHPDPSADGTIEAPGDLCQFDFTAFVHV